RGEQLPAGTAFEREESCEHRTPGEVDSLPRRGRLREGPVRLDQGLERATDLAGRHRAEAGAAGWEVRLPAAEGLERLDADQFPLPIVVRGEDDFLDRVGEAAQRVVEGHGRLFPDGLEVDQVVEVRPGPIPRGLRIIELDDVSAERKHDDV